jgi:hypothetical protein
VGRIVGDPDLRYVDLNRAINGGYGQFGRLFQEILDPAFDGTSSAVPNWYAIAAYASRSAGRSLLALQAALEALQDLDHPPTTCDLLRRISPDLGPVASVAAAWIDRTFHALEDRLGAALLVGAALLSGGSLADLLDPRLLIISVRRLAELVRAAPGQGLAERLQVVLHTQRNTLEEANRAIFADIGGAGEAYLRWRRRQGRVTPGKVLSHFPLGQPGQSREIYRWALAAARRPGPLPTDLEARFPPSRYDLTSVLTAAFALYEKARGATSAERRNRLAELANILMAYREQYQVVQPTFSPPSPLPGEVDRSATMRLVTPFVSVPMRWGTWSYRDFVEKTGPDRDGNWLTPPCTERNWAVFEDRWEGIMDAFRQVERRARDMWPMPHPDPATDLPRPSAPTPDGLPDPTTLSGSAALEGWLSRTAGPGC